MNWKEENDEWYLNTPIGKMRIKKDSGTYDAYCNDNLLGSYWDLKNAQDEVKVNLSVTYYRLKILLEL